MLELPASSSQADTVVRAAIVKTKLALPPRGCRHRQGHFDLSPVRSAPPLGEEGAANGALVWVALLLLADGDPAWGGTKLERWI